MVQPIDEGKNTAVPPSPDKNTSTSFNSTNSAFHQKHQIKWRDLDMKKFFVLNVAFNFATDSVMYPLDVIRTRMQVQVCSTWWITFSTHYMQGSSMIQTSYPKYRNSLDCVRQIVKQEGMRGIL